MKKQFKISAAAIASASVLVPALAASPVGAAEQSAAPQGFYDLNKNEFISLADFKNLPIAGKAAILKNANNHLVVSGKVFSTTNILTLSDSALEKSGVEVAAFEADKNVNLNQISQNPVNPSPGVPTPTPGSFQVESVKAINPTEIQVKFNKAVDETTALDLANYTLTINGDKYAVASGSGYTAYSTVLSNIDSGNATLKGEAFNPTTNTVTFKLTGNELANADQYSIDVKNGVLSSDKKSKVDKYSDSVKTFNDTSAPVLKEASLNSANKLVLTFDEPVTNIGLVKIDDVTVYNPSAAPNAAPTFGENTNDYTVTLNDVIPEELSAVGKHNVVAYDVEDSLTSPSSNKATAVTGSYTISVDTVAPAVTKTAQVSNDSRSFDITFSEPVSWSNFKSSVLNNDASLTVKKGNYTFTLDEDVTPADATYKVTQLKNNVWRITFSADNDSINPLYTEDENSAPISLALAGYKDAANNVGNKYTGSLTIKRDLSAPAIKQGLENKISGNATIDVKLTKKSSFVNGSADLAKIKVTDKDGIARTVTGAVLTGANNDVLQVTLDNTFNSSNPANDKAPFKVSISAGLVKSDEEVKNAADSVTIDKDNTAAPVVAAVKDANVAGAATVVNGVNVNTITIPYTQEMGASAADLSNYTLDGKALTGAKISLNNDNDVVTITLPEGFAKVNNKQLLEISKDVKTKKGSSVVKDETTKAAYSKLVEIKDNTQPVLSKAVFLVGDADNDTQTDTIKLTFSENLENVNLSSTTATDDIFSDLAVIIGGTKHSIAEVIDETPGNKELVIKLKNNISLANTVDVESIGLTTKNTSVAIKDAAGNFVKAGTVRVAGKEVDLTVIANQGAANLASVQAADTAVTNTTFTSPLANTVDTETAAKAAVKSKVDTAVSDNTVTTTITGVTFTAPVTGTNGSIKFKVEYKKGSQTVTSSEYTQVITAK